MRILPSIGFLIISVLIISAVPGKATASSYSDCSLNVRILSFEDKVSYLKKWDLFRVKSKVKVLKVVKQGGFRPLCNGWADSKMNIILTFKSYNDIKALKKNDKYNVLYKRIVGVMYDKQRKRRRLKANTSYNVKKKLK